MSARWGFGLINIVLLLGLLWVSSARGASYYFDATQGSDSNNCTSQGTACQSITKANSLTLNPGDILHFQRGETWQITTGLRFVSGRSGTSINPITIRDYGSGALPIVRAPSVSQATGFHCENSDWLVIENMQFSTIQRGMRFLGCKHIVSRNNILRDTGNVCFSWQASSTGRTSQFGEVFGHQNLSCGDIDFGEGFYIALSTGNDTSGDIYIHDNIIYDNTNECLDLKNDVGGGATNVRFERNVCVRTATSDLDSQRQQLESFGTTSSPTNGNHLLKYNYLQDHVGNAHGVRLRNFGGTIARNIIEDVPQKGIEIGSPNVFTVTVTGNTIWSAGGACHTDASGNGVFSQNLCQDNGSGNTCTGSGNTLVSPSTGNFTLPAGSTCLSTGALRPFGLTSGVIEPSGTSVLLTFPVDSEYVPVQCPADASTAISLASCSIAGAVSVAGCTVVGTTQLRVGLAETVQQGETGCTVSLVANTISDSATIGGQFATQISTITAGAYHNLLTPNSQNFAVTNQALTNSSTAGETEPNLLTLANMVPGTCPECAENRPWSALLDQDVISENGSTGNHTITSFSGEHDLGVSGELATFRAWCDAVGDWDTQHVTFEYKVNSGDAYTVGVNHQVCNDNQWFTFPLGNVSGRYVRVTFFCETACEGVQAREIHLAGTPDDLPLPGARPLHRRSLVARGVWR